MWRALSLHHPFCRWLRSQNQETVCQSRHLCRRSHLVLVLNVDGQEIRRLEFKDKRLLPVNNNKFESRYNSPLGSTFLPPRWELKNAFWLDKQTEKLFATILAPEVEVIARAIFPTANIEAMINWKTNLSTGFLELFPVLQSSSDGHPEWKLAIGSEDGMLWGYGAMGYGLWAMTDQCEERRLAVLQSSVSSKHPAIEWKQYGFHQLITDVRTTVTRNLELLSLGRTVERVSRDLELYVW